MLHNCSAMVLVKNDEYFLPYSLMSTLGLFKRYVIYDVGSTDETRTIISEFIKSSDDDIEFIIRALPHCPPVVQGTFRNSMIAESLTDWYFILDGDEVYSEEAVKSLRSGFSNLVKAHASNKDIIYGVCWRKEITRNLEGAFSEIRTHHRFYHRTAIWTGNHPGEAPLFQQKPHREYYFSKQALCHHFHNPIRSSKEDEVPKRMDRKSRKTYAPGDIVSIDILEELPILNSEWDFEDNPQLKDLKRRRSVPH